MGSKIACSANTERSGMRVRGEHIFGHIETAMRACFVRTIGFARGVVVSGIWYAARGEDFAPEATVTATAGSFLRRVANTPLYDGVIKGVSEPAVIAISGIGPIHYHLIEPDKPGWRAV